MMERDGRRLGWIAIALGGLALIVALSGRMHSSQAYYGPQGYYGPPPAYQAQPGPRGQFGPKGQFGPQGDLGPQGQLGPQGEFGPMQEWRREVEMRRGHWGGGPHRGFGPLFLLPFMLIGGLIKLAFVVLLIWLGLRLLRGRGFGGPRGHGPGGHSPPPGPEQPPYTGDTEQI
jgi:hypothetical protein